MSFVQSIRADYIKAHSVCQIEVRGPFFRYVLRMYCLMNRLLTPASTDETTGA